MSIYHQVVDGEIPLKVFHGRRMNYDRWCVCGWVFGSGKEETLKLVRKEVSQQQKQEGQWKTFISELGVAFNGLVAACLPACLTACRSTSSCLSTIIIEGELG